MTRSSARTRHTRAIIAGIAVVLFVLFIAPYILWLLTPPTDLAVAVIDKTAGSDLQEHRSFFWLLRHWKYRHPQTGDLYEQEGTYYGFHPEDSSYDRPAALQLDGADVVYVTDTYGVFRTSVPQEEYEELLPERFIPGTHLYGGLDSTELSALESYAASGGMLIGEFNILQDPQERSAELRTRLERLFGVRSTGILGRYYEDLTDAPLWVKEAYAQQERTAWRHRGKGIVITHERRRIGGHPRVVVLGSEDLAYSPVFLRTTDHWSVRHAGDDVPYFHFFEVLGVEPGAQVAAYFDLRCTQQGKEKLIRDSIPLSFPAVVAEERTAPRFYFAGDFADNAVEPFLAHYWQAEAIFGRAYSLYYIPDQTRYFWRFYLPLMRDVLDHAASRRRTEE